MNTADRKRAEKVLAAVLAKYPEAKSAPELDRPQILDCEGVPVVSWESGPFEWALRFTMGGTDWEVFHMARAEGMATLDAQNIATSNPTSLKGIYMEPYYSFSLAVYED